MIPLGWLLIVLVVHVECKFQLFYNLGYPFGHSFYAADIRALNCSYFHNQQQLAINSSRSSENANLSETCDNEDSYCYSLWLVALEEPPTLIRKGISYFYAGPETNLVHFTSHV